MEHYEMAELLAKKAGVTLELARQTLTENDWDMLDAMVALEKTGKGNGAVRVDAEAAEDAGSAADSGEPESPKRVKNMDDGRGGFRIGCRRLWHYIKRAFQLTLENDFIIIRRDKQLLGVPVLVLIILLCVGFWCVFPLLIIGLFFGCQYRFEGRQIPSAVNRVMEKAEDMADHIRDTLDQDGQ